MLSSRKSVPNKNTINIPHGNWGAFLWPHTSVFCRHLRENLFPFSFFWQEPKCMFWLVIVKVRIFCVGRILVFVKGVQSVTIERVLHMMMSSSISAIHIICTG